jgi:hypothetical protein
VLRKIVLFSGIHKNVLCGQNVEILCVKIGVIKRSKISKWLNWNQMIEKMVKWRDSADKIVKA